MNVKSIKSKLTAAFSLIELMVVIAIVALLTAIAVPSYQGYLQQSKVTEIFSLASDQMNQWVQNYNLGSANFDLAFPTTGTGLGSYITSSEISSGGTVGAVTNGGTAVTGCPANGNGGTMGVVCLKLNAAAGTAIDPSLAGLVIYFTPAQAGTSTGDTTNTTIAWSCNFVSSTAVGGATGVAKATSLLQPGNCTGI